MADAASMQTRARARTVTQPVRISEADERRLTRYLGALGTQFERSVFGRVLEVQELAGASSTRCRRCQGSGIIDGPGGFGVFIEEVQATRQAPTKQGIEGIPDESVRWEKRERQVGAGGWCRGCNGTGSVPKTEEPPVCDHCEGRKRVVAFNNRPGCHEAPCRVCLGTGVRRTTAELMGSSVEGAGSLPSEEALHQYAVTSRQLGAVRARSQLCSRAIELLFGDQGARWACMSGNGRLFAVFQETAAGKKLVKWAEARDAARAQADREKVLAKLGRKKKAKGKAAPARPGWKNPAPAVDAFAFAAAPPPATATEEMWERAWRKVRRCKTCRGRGWFAAFNHRPGVHRAPCEACAGTGETQRQAPRGWLPGAAVERSQHEAPRPPVDLTAAERIWAEVEAQRKKPDVHRGRLLLEAAEQARQLYVRACKLWVQVGAGLGRKLTPRQVEEREAVVRIHHRLRSSGNDTAANYIAAQVKAR